MHTTYPRFAEMYDVDEFYKCLYDSRLYSANPNTLEKAMQAASQQQNWQDFAQN